MNTAVTELVITLPKKIKKEKKETEKKEKDPQAPIVKKPRKKKIKGIFKIEHGNHIVVFE